MDTNTQLAIICVANKIQECRLEIANLKLKNEELQATNKQNLELIDKLFVINERMSEIIECIHQP